MMEVMLMRGGFRGLGDLSTNDQLQLLNWLESETNTLEPAVARIRAAARERRVPLEVAQLLDRRFEALRDRIVALTERLSGPEFEMFTGDAPVEGWRTEARAVIRDVRAYTRDVGTALGEIEVTGAKVATIAVVTALVLGGGVFLLYRYGQKGRRLRRRR